MDGLAGLLFICIKHNVTRGLIVVESDGALALRVYQFHHNYQPIDKMNLDIRKMIVWTQNRIERELGISLKFGTCQYIDITNYSGVSSNPLKSLISNSTRRQKISS